MRVVALDTTGREGSVALVEGQRVVAERRGDAYWNPLRPGAMTPFEDYGPPVVSRTLASQPLDAISGRLNLIV